MKKLVLLSCLVTLLFSCSGGGNKPKEIGLQLYSIRTDIKKDLDNGLKMTADAGYTFVEAAGYKDGKFYNKTPKEFLDLCKKHGLEFISSHIVGPDPNVETPEKCKAWWDKAIAAHKEIGVAYIVQPIMSGKAFASLEGLQKYCEFFNQVGEWCNAAGIKFGYHNHGREFKKYFDVNGQQIRVYDYMLQNTDPSKVFFQMDLYWVQVGGGNIVEYFNKYPGRFLEWHVKDEKELGASGTMDFEAMYNAAKTAGLKYQIVEQEAFTEGKTAFQSIKESRDYLQNAPFAAAKY